MGGCIKTNNYLKTSDGEESTQRIKEREIVESTFDFWSIYEEINKIEYEGNTDVLALLKDQVSACINR